MKNQSSSRMKLYNIPRDSRIYVKEIDTYLNFDHIDGMYSYCTDDQGQVVHLSAWAEVEVVDG